MQLGGQISNRKISTRPFPPDYSHKLSIMQSPLNITGDYFDKVSSFANYEHGNSEISPFTYDVGG